MMALFTTGYARGILHEDAELLAKSFTPEALACRMRDLIERCAAWGVEGGRSRLCGGRRSP